MGHVNAEHGRRSFSDRFAIISFASVILCLTALTWTRYLYNPVSQFFPLFHVADRYNDLWNYNGKMLHLERGASSIGNGYPIFNYLAPAAFVYHVLLSSPHPVATFKVLVSGSLALLLAGSAMFLSRQGLFRWDNALGLLALALSFPMTFVIYRCNLEGVVWAAVTASLCLFLRRWYTAAAVFLGLAMSVKPFPVLLVLLFLARRQYRAAVLSIGLAAVLVVWGLAALGPGVMGGYRGLQPGVLLYTDIYIRTFRSPYEQEYAHGILDVLKVLYGEALWFFSHIAPEALEKQPTPLAFPVIDGVLALIVGAGMVWKLRTMPTLNQVLGAGIALTLLPPSAADYTLCSLYLPVLLIGYVLATEVRSGHLRWGTRHMLLLVLPCAALLSPLTLFGFWTSPVRLLLLLLLCAGAVTLPLALPALDVNARHTSVS